MKTLDLGGAWQFRAIESGTPLEVSRREALRWHAASVPGTVHTDLMACGLIPDPFYRMQEKDVQWVDGIAWEYRKEFRVPQGFLAEAAVDLVAAGLDTYATIRCNGRVVHRGHVRRTSISCQAVPA